MQVSANHSWTQTSGHEHVVWMWSDMFCLLQEITCQSDKADRTVKFSFFKILLMWFQLFAQTGHSYITIFVQRIFPQPVETLLIITCEQRHTWRYGWKLYLYIDIKWKLPEWPMWTPNQSRVVDQNPTDMITELFQDKHDESATTMIRKTLSDC